MLCQCGEIAQIAGRCAPCYRADANSRRRFDGRRAEVLARDGGCRGCGETSRRRLHVHHRVPGVNDPAKLATVCVRCHPTIHKLRALRAWLPAGLVELWEEQHQGAAVQLQFAYAA